MTTATNIHYEPAQRTRVLGAGGLDAILLLARMIHGIGVGGSMDLFSKERARCSPIPQIMRDLD